MRTENGQTLDLEALNALLQKADVITIGFTLITERLLVDTRANDEMGQFAEMVEPVANVQERHVWLGRHRGSFGAPEGFAFFVWPHTVRGLSERDILAPLKVRLQPETIVSLESALAEAADGEARAIKAMIAGTEAWPAMWPAA